MLTCFCAFSQSNAVYTMKKSETNNMVIGRTYTNDAFIDLSGITTPVTSFAVSGSISLSDYPSLVRIILVTNNYQYLVYEAYPLICESNSFSFSKVCDETDIMGNETPVKLIIIVKNASLSLDKIYYSTTLLTVNENTQLAETKLATKRHVENNKATIINMNNTKNYKTWIADTTGITLLSFENRKNLFGGNNDFNAGGFEYYADGIFSFPDFDPKTAIKSGSKTTYVEKFDWRNRHGKNWMTSVKNQGNCGACSAFSAVGTTEAMFNIYYNNDNIDLDLSEQEVFSCCSGNCSYGLSLLTAVNFIKNTGVVNETCFPYIDYGPPPCSNTCSYPDEKINISTTQSISGTEDAFKHALINIGPLAGAINTLGHAMPLLGYNTIVAGDTICFPKNGGCSDSIIQTGSSYIGLTYWIFKNSYGDPLPGQPHFHGHHGYLYIFQSINQIYAYTAEEPYSTNSYIRNCTDADGDGYYWWGTGNKPSTCPDCAPDDKDGNDADATIGPMDEYGNCTIISSPYEATHDITTTVSWSNTSICGDVYVYSGGGNLTIDNTDVNIYSSFTVEQGGVLTINSGVIQ